MDAAQSMQVNSILLATMAGAMVVLAGALYAAVFAIGKISNSQSLVRLSYLFYGVLVVSVLVLARTLDFAGFWNLVAVVMLVGYFLAPHGIWMLCAGTHVGSHADNSANDVQNDSGSSLKGADNRAASDSSAGRVV